MSFPRPLPIFLSALFAIGLWVYGAAGLRTGGGEIRGGYATLVCGEAYSDREIRDGLDSLGLTGVVSESDQWFLLDCFGGIEKIPLVEYPQRLLPFDPRNDGYAEKLKSLFVRDGKRYIYIPLAVNRPENLETDIARALNGISYSLEYTRIPRKRDIFLPLTALCLTACAFFIIPVLRRRLNAGLLPCLLTLSPLALGLAPGFALSALLAGFAALLAAEPGRKPHLQGRQAAYDLPKPFTNKWLLSASLAVCYVCFSFFSGLPVLFAFFVLASFCCVLAVSVITGGGRITVGFNVNRWYPQRRRFTPVEIISRNTANWGFFPVMLPFAAMALALALAGFARPHPAASPPVNVSPLPAGLITEADFQEHYLFQSSFSFRAMGKKDEALPPVIAAYELSSNGLLAPAVPGVNEELQIPDFPLGDLLRGISPDSPRAIDAENHVTSSPVDLILALPPVIFILPAFLYSIKKKRQGKIVSGFRGFYRRTC